MKNLILFTTVLISLFTVLCHANDAESIWEEQDGLLVIEAENGSYDTTLWKELTEFGEYSGESYIEYTGKSNMKTPVLEESFSYKIKINTPGIYQFQWYSRNGKTAEATDAENDSWLMIEADSYYGVKKVDGVWDTVYCDDEYMKVWIHDLDNWSWKMKGEHGHLNGMFVHAVFDSAGEYSINIAGRSQWHVIDRMVMHLDTVTDPTNLEHEETLFEEETATKPLLYSVDGYSLVVAPNPMVRNNTIFAEVLKTQEYSFNLYNSTGAKVASTIELLESGRGNSFKWSILDKLSAGVYYVEMRDKSHKLGRILVTK